MAIQPKKMPVIKKGAGYTYVEATFAKEHKVKNFYRVEDPVDLLARVKPFEMLGRHFITFDTETHPHFTHSIDVSHTVRRWVGTGKSATPQDYPFCISICDGTNCYTLFDSVENDFKKLRALAPLLEDETIEKIAHNTN